VAVRVALGVLAVAALAWLALGLRAARLESEAADLAGPSPAAAPRDRLERALDAYRRARSFNADTAPEVREAGLLNFHRRRREALELLRDVVQREPENWDAWTLISGVAAEVDPALAERARRRASELNPLDFRRPR
jgi:hypothetical protein